MSASLSKRYPQLYKEGIRNSFFKWRVIAVWGFFAFYQSIVFFYFTASASRHGQGSSGKILGLWDVSTMAFSCVVVTVNLRLLMACNSITRWHYISVAGSIVAWFVFIFIYSAIMTSFDRQVGYLFAFFSNLLFQWWLSSLRYNCFCRKMCILWFMFWWAPFSSTSHYCLFRSSLCLVTSYIYRKIPGSCAIMT